jgi:hypothetical protein
MLYATSVHSFSRFCQRSGVHDVLAPRPLMKHIVSGLRNFDHFCYVMFFLFLRFCAKLPGSPLEHMASLRELHYSMR